MSSIGGLPAPSPLLADYLDPTSNDFVSLFTSLDPIDLQVVLALKLVRGSGAAVTEDGNNLMDIRKISSTILSEISSEVNIALARLIRNGDIRYRGLKNETVDAGNQYVQWTVEWNNLRAFNAGQVRTAALTYTQ